MIPPGTNLKRTTGICAPSWTRSISEMTDFMRVTEHYPNGSCGFFDLRQAQQLLAARSKVRLNRKEPYALDNICYLTRALSPLLHTPYWTQPHPFSPCHPPFRLNL